MKGLWQKSRPCYLFCAEHFVLFKEDKCIGKVDGVLALITEDKSGLGADGGLALSRHSGPVSCHPQSQPPTLAEAVQSYCHRAITRLHYIRCDMRKAQVMNLACYLGKGLHPFFIPF